MYYCVPESHIQKRSSSTHLLIPRIMAQLHPVQRSPRSPTSFSMSKMRPPPCSGTRPCVSTSSSDALNMQQTDALSTSSWHEGSSETAHTQKQRAGIGGMSKTLENKQYSNSPKQLGSFYLSSNNRHAPDNLSFLLIKGGPESPSRPLLNDWMNGWVGCK